MEYRILLLQNGKFKKQLHQCKNTVTSKDNYKRILAENENIIFPRNYLTSDNITPVLYEVCRVKEFDEKDRERTIRDRMGRLVPPVVLWDKWTVLEYEYYNIEETFYVFGYNPISDRKDFNFILGLLVKGIADNMLTKDIIILHNKIFIYNQHQFDIILCKCKHDAIRLYNLLLDVSKDNKMKRLLFMGQASERMTGVLYEMMMDVTGWDYRKVTRTATNT